MIPLKNPKKRKIAIVCIFTFILIGVLIYYFYSDSKVCIEENCFDVEIADSPEELQKGLMFLEYMPKDEGMLFVFPKEEKHAFWMKNTFIPLDIIWIDANQTIVFISEKTLPCNATCDSIRPLEDSRYVLELNAGIVEEYKFEIGDKVSFAHI